MTMDLCGYTHCAIDSVVQRDRGVSAFRQEWILWYFLQYTSTVHTHYVQLTHIHRFHVWRMNLCESGPFMHLFCPTTNVEEVLVLVRGLRAYTTRYIACLMVFATFLIIAGVVRARRAPLTYVIRLSNLENSNVQHGFSCNHINYQSLEEDYSDQYNSTKTTSCHMIFAPLVYIDIDINVSKCQSCGHSIRGETKDLVDNISSAQKPERTIL